MLLLWWYNPGNLRLGVGGMRLENKVALISGGARGMGAAEARLFAREGAKVVIGDVLEEDGHQTEAQINESGRECLFVRLDVTSEANWQEAVATTVARFGKLDINGKGVFLGTKCAIPEMRKIGGGSIINISSTAGLRGSPGAAAYGASKGAVRLFTKSTAIQYAKDNIRANSVHPGIIETDMTLPTILTDDEARKGRIARTPIGRIGQPDDVAYGVLFLASDESSFMTGSELVIDGGRTAQ